MCKKKQQRTRELPPDYQLISQQKLYKPEGNGMIHLKWWKGRTYNQEYHIHQDSHSYWWRNQKLSRQARVKIIQHHQTSFTTNAKETSLGRKHNRRKRSTENKPKTIKKMVIGSCVYAQLLQSFPTLCDPMDCSLSDYSVYGTLQARILQ